MQGVRAPQAMASLGVSQADPSRDYAAALVKWEALRAQDGAEVNPVCRSTLLTHGARTEQAAVLVHGVTNCPQQFVQLAPLLFDQGYNVLIPRIPWNGFLDRSGEAMRNLTAQQLRAFSDAVVDIACGLGERVSVLGLSGGGVVTAWIAQHRAEVERAVVIAPSIGIVPQLPVGNVAINRLVMRVMRSLPNFMTQRVLPIKAGPPHNYFGFATRGLSAVCQLGFAVLDAAKRREPAAHSIVVVINQSDRVVNNKVACDLSRRWQARAGAHVRTYTFTADHKLIHDLIDPTQPGQQTAFVYPILLHLLTLPTAEVGGFLG
jgi:pimeloyl-ACP methyl ester carboxylesterase